MKSSSKQSNHSPPSISESQPPIESYSPQIPSSNPTPIPIANAPPSIFRQIITQIPIQLPNLVPLHPPQIDPFFEKHSWLERSEESIRYLCQLIEYGLSPSGRLRQWIKLNLLLFFAVGVPLLFFLPLITYAFHQFTDISQYFQQCMTHLFLASVPVVILAFLLSLIVMMIKK